MHQNGDLSSISSSAQALMQLQSTHGLFPRLTGKGDKAKTLADMLLKMRQESIIDSRTTLYGVGQSQSIESLIIIDREVDFITPLLTQLTYEGLIDEKNGIKNSEHTSCRSDSSFG
jgi:vacuolar protein sorting-associated protein 33A